jgi:hypothetical protein
MARINGLTKKTAPWHLKWFFSVSKRFFGKEITPAGIKSKVPGVQWADILMDRALASAKRVESRTVFMAKIRTASLVGCPF